MQTMNRTKSLAELKPGESARIARITARDTLLVRLMEMGVLTGETVQVIKYAPLGDPIELRLRGHHLSLRRGEAEQILVEAN